MTAGLDALARAGYNASVKACFLPLLAFVVLLSACATHRSAPPLTTPTGRPEIEIHAPMERVRLSIITQQTGEGAAILDSASESRLTFVTQVSKPTTEISYDLKPSGAPYVRATYVLTTETRGTHVSVSSEIVSNYGTASARARPLNNSLIRQAQQRDLLRLRAIVEMPQRLKTSD